jgi:uncharacterized membrane protein YphA (DoxX/SURF4 family)
MATQLLQESAPRPAGDVTSAGADITPGRRAASGGHYLRAREARAIAVVRMAFGVIWAVDAALKWLPSFAEYTLMDTLGGAAADQPPLVQAWIDGWIGVADAFPAGFAIGLALAETSIAVGLLGGVFTNAVCLAGAGVSLLIWSTGEGFGGPYGDGSTDVGASPIYVLVFALLAVVGAGGTWGLDRLLHPHLGRFRWVSSRPWGGLD